MIELLNPQFSTWPAEKNTLSFLLKESPGKYAIEIGCFRGVTSLFLGEICKKLDKKLICIDPWANTQDHADDSVYYYFLETVKPVQEAIITIRDFSDNALKKLPEDIKDNCGFIFVDGDHSFDGTYKDLVNYYEILKKEGVLTVHDVFDAGWKGVGEAFDKFLQSGMTAYYKKYIPTKTEVYNYQHGVSGLGWVFKK